jgi:subfamily B ATP-binding cassette protein MsbA
MKGRFGKTWELLEPHARPRLASFLLVILLGMGSAASQAYVLWLVKPLIYIVFPGQGAPGVSAQDASTEQLTGKVARWTDGLLPFDDWRLRVLCALSLFALVLGLAAGLCQWGYTWISRQIGLQMITDLRVRVARHLLGLSMRYHGERRFGDLLSRISSDVGTTLWSVDITLRTMLLDSLQALATLAAMIVLAPVPALLVLLFLPLALFPVSRITRRVRRGSKKSLASLGTSVQALTQMFSGVRTVKAFGGEEREIARYRELNHDYTRQAMRMVRAVALSEAWTAFYSIVGVALLVFAMGWIQLRFRLFADGATLGAFFLMVARLNNHVKDFTKARAKVEESVGASERVLALLEEKPDVVERPGATAIGALGSGIRFEGVSFRFAGGERDAIRALDLEVRPGETLALVGPSGAGKSTLVDLVARFIDPSAGRITVDGRDLRELRLADWNALYAMVGQLPFLFHATVGENIAYGKQGATRAEIEAAARAAHIHDFIAGLPQGYDTNVADMGSRLSGGQRQRITIARALLKGAPLLLLDEATSALDSESEVEVQRALEHLMEQRTVIVIAHRLSTVRTADRIAVLDEGRLVELGTHDDLLARNGLYARLYRLQNLEAPRAGELSGLGSRA